MLFNIKAFFIGLFLPLLLQARLLAPGAGRLGWLPTPADLVVTQGRADFYCICPTRLLFWRALLSLLGTVLHCICPSGLEFLLLGSRDTFAGLQPIFVFVMQVAQLASVMASDACIAQLADLTFFFFVFFHLRAI